MSLLIWLPLLGNLENQGISAGKIENMGAVAANSSGKIGQCMSFTGAATSNIRLPPILKNTDDFSITFWVKFNTNVNQCLFSQRTAITDTGFTIFYLNGTNIRLDEGKQLIATSVVTTNTWYHVACCRDSTKTYIYINGVLKASGTRSSTNASYVNSNYAFIGGSQQDAAGTPAQSNANLLNGYLNDYRIYNHCLSPAEVHEISQGLVLHYKLDSFQGMRGNANLLKSIPKYYSSGSYCAYQLEFTENLIANQTYTLQLWDVNVAHSAKSAANLGIAFYWGGGSVQLVYPKGTSYFTNGHADYIKISFTPTETNASHANAANLWFNVYNSPSNADGTRSMSIGRWKLEKGSSATSWQDSNDILDIIQDSSGYNNHGTVNGGLTLTSNTHRYSASMVFNGSNTFIAAGRKAMVKDAITINVWGYKATWNNAGQIMSCTEGGGWNFENSSGAIQFPVGTGASSNTYKVAKNTSVTWAGLSSGWHMFTGTYDGLTVKLFVDGDLKASNTAYTTKTPIYYHKSNGIFIGAEAAGNQTTPAGTYWNGGLSDFRIYATALSDTDIKQLYEMGAKVDNKGNLHAYEFNEFNSNKLKKTGVFYNYATEPYIQLADGSYWKLLLFHYVDNGTNLFTSTTAQYNDGFGLYSRLRDIDNFKYNNKYEFYVIQDGATHRWAQTNAPLTTTSVTGFTSISGSPNSGLCKCNGNTLLARTSTTSSWWNAAGCWTLYQGGIPGFGGHVVCKQYVALYVRIDKITYHNASNAHYVNNLIEF